MNLISHNLCVHSDDGAEIFLNPDPSSNKINSTTDAHTEYTNLEAGKAYPMAVRTWDNGGYYKFNMRLKQKTTTVTNNQYPYSAHSEHEFKFTVSHENEIQRVRAV